MSRTHHYSLDLTWPTRPGDVTRSRDTYSRDHEVAFDGKPALALSSDPAFRGTASRHNPEELLVASLASCHMLWYLDLCARAGIVVTGYRDKAQGEMIEAAGGEGRFERVVLRPEVTIEAGDTVAALALHEEAHRYCFIANSVAFPVLCEPAIVVTPTKPAA